MVKVTTYIPSIVALISFSVLEWHLYDETCKLSPFYISFFITPIVGYMVGVSVCGEERRGGLTTQPGAITAQLAGGQFSRTRDYALFFFFFFLS